ncbi:hypothetical protein [Paraburkholderia phosphatilytica]|nr:hypothetical protein [Paraburkholderia phosphatilytica]
MSDTNRAYINANWWFSPDLPADLISRPVAEVERFINSSDYRALTA